MSTVTDETLNGTGPGDVPEPTGIIESDLAEDTEPQAADETPEAEVDQQPPKPMQIPIPGTIEGISSLPGGSAPTVSEARLMGGSLPIEGEFEGEEFVTLVVTAKVNEVDFVYTTDDWGNTTVVKRRHKMRMISVRRQAAES